MLDSLVATQKENNARLAAIEKSVNALVSINKKTEAREKLESKRAATLARREKTRRKAPATAIEKKEEKQKKKSFIDNIIDALKGPVMAAGAIGLVVAALSDPKVQKALGDAISNLKPVFKDIAVMMGQAFIDAVKAGLQGMAKAFLGDPLKQGGAASRRFEREAQTAREEMDSLPQGQARREYMKDNQYYDKLNFKYKHLDEKVRSDFAVLRAKQAELDAVRNQESEEKIKLAKEKVKQEEERRERVINALKEANVDNKYKLTDEELKEATTPLKAAQLRGMQAPGLMGWMQQNLFPQSLDFDALDAAGHQRGGSIQVPGSGDGDKVPAILPAGSFVMNKIATSAMGYQEGGVPVMLEPGERVYGPGSWGPMEHMMNSMIPRFQSGGFVGSTNIVDTGYRDYKGRAAKLSPEAAQGLKCMIDKGMPWNPGDVANVYRDKAEYNRLLRAGYSPAQRSKHNFGEAMDVHGSMGRWIRQKGSSCGWGPNDYAGSHGGHYEFFGGAKSPASDETYSNKQQTGPGGVKGEDAAQIRGDSRGAQAANNSLVSGAIDNPISEGVGGFFNMFGQAAQDGARKAGLPGMADVMHMYSEGFRQSKAYTVLPALIGGIANFAQGFIGSLTGGLFGGKPASAGQQPGGFMNRNQGGNSALGGLSNPTSRGGNNLGGPSATPLSGGSGKLNLTDEQYKELAFIVSAEARRGTADEFGVAANVLTRVADPGYPGTIRGVGRQHKQYEAVEKGLAHYDDKLAQHLKANSGSIAAAMEKLNGRTEFKGTAMYHNMGSSDIKFSDTGNFYHYASQRGKYDPAPSNPPQHWRKFVGKQTGGIINMTGSASNNMRRYEQAMDNFKTSFAESQSPIIVPVPIPSGGGGAGGGYQVTGSGATPPPPDLPSGPQVVALLELQNRLALGAAL